ncbi:MAG TPA: sigma-70 family RNA polymerase sigma factor [Spirochaetota bacterium]|nr:sigma-70 family RNA polymerase sigma factor [Spirochaetota bacterium]
MDDEKLLIERIKLGETELFAVLLDKYQDRLYAFVLRTVRNEDDAVDIVQEVFFKAYRSLSSYKARAKFSTWLFRIGYNHAVDFIRKKNKRAAEKNIDSVTLSDERYHNRELFAFKNFMDKMIAKLPRRYAAVLHLFYKEGKSYADIAGITGQKLNTIKSDILRGKNKLKEILIDFENDNRYFNLKEVCNG